MSLFINILLYLCLVYLIIKLKLGFEFDLFAKWTNINKLFFLGERREVLFIYYKVYTTPTSEPGAHSLVTVGPTRSLTKQTDTKLGQVL